MTLSILDIVEDTTVDGPGFRTAIYAAGCTHRCVGCHNLQSWDINNGKRMPVESLVNKILENDFADVTFTGGDPLFQPEGFTRLAYEIKKRSHKNIWCYTGMRYEKILENPIQFGLLQYIDVLVDGPFEQSLYHESLIFKGSSNQRIIDVQRSLKKSEIVLLQYNPFVEACLI